MEFSERFLTQVFTLIEVKVTIRKWNEEEIILEVGEWNRGKVDTYSYELQRALRDLEMTLRVKA